MGFYAPPNNSTTTVYIMAALGRFSQQWKVNLVGDLDLDFDSSKLVRDLEIAHLLATSRLLDINHHFMLHWNFNQQTSWHQKHKEKVVQSRLDYFLCTDQQSIQKYSICDPCHFVTDHKLVYGVLMANTLKENKRLLRARTRFPYYTLKWDLY